VLPPKLAQAVGATHRFTEPHGSAPEGRLEIAEEHAGGVVSQGDMGPFLTGERDEITGVNLNGGLFQVLKGLGRYRARLPENPESSEEVADAALAVYRDRQGNGRADLASWYERVQNAAIDHYDYRDRFLVEQGFGGYNGSKEIVSDLLPAERFTAMNCGRFLGDILRLPDEARAGGELPKKLINRYAPQLLEWPVNPPDTDYLTKMPLHLLRRHVSRQLRFHGLGAQ
jgi:hypothetical protein